MVDINLFKNDGEEGKEEKEWDSESSEGDDFENAMKDDLGFDDDLSGQDTFDEGGLLDEEEPLPDFDEPEGEDQHGKDYEFGEVKEKKSSLWLWILMGVIVVAVVLYVFFIQPKQIAKSTKVVHPVKPPVMTSKTAPPKAEDTTAQDQEKTVPVAAQSGTVPVAGAVSTVVAYVNASKAIFDDLATKAQFGAILLNGNQFLIEYVSETPGVAEQMGYRIKTLLGVSEYKVSPEDRHRTGGKISYWGIVSGQLSLTETGQVGPKTFASTQSFIQSIDALAKRHGLAAIVTKPVDAKVTIKMEGSSSNIMQFLQSMKRLQGNYKLEKLFMNSLDYSDFQGSELKLILDFQIV
jgi:acylphosphatase